MRTLQYSQHFIDLTTLHNLSKEKRKMGRWKNKKQKNTIKDEIFHRLNNMREAGHGHSRNEDKQTGIDKNYIYSSRTYKTYLREAKLFATWCIKQHPDVKHLKQLKPYVNEYLQAQIDASMSVWTITTRKAAIAKTLNMDYCSFIQTPPRERKNIKRSRNSVSRDKHISAETEAIFAALTSACGLRRNEMIKICGTDLEFDNKSGKYYLNVTKGTKGGKPRRCWIIGENKEDRERIVKLFKDAGHLRVCPHLPSSFDNHYYRAKYTKRLYNSLARPTALIPRNEQYITRKDRAGEVLDRLALRQVSLALGHTRISVIPLSYLY